MAIHWQRWRRSIWKQSFCLFLSLFSIFLHLQAQLYVWPAVPWLTDFYTSYILAETVIVYNMFSDVWNSSKPLRDSASLLSLKQPTESLTHLHRQIFLHIYPSKQHGLISLIIVKNYQMEKILSSRLNGSWPWKGFLQQDITSWV